MSEAPGSDDQLSFSGRSAVVTGAGAGIGAATAIRLARNGVQVVVADIDTANAESVAASIVERGGTAKPFTMDVGDPAQSQAMVEFAVSTFGGLHYALNNVALATGRAPIGEIDLADWHRGIEISLNGTLYGLRYEIPAILESGGGAIVNVSSIAGLQATVRNAAYVTAKHALVGLTRAASMEYAARGVRVNSVHPGYIDTPRLRAAVSSERQQELAIRHPIGRLGTAEEVANLVTFLLSDAAAFMTGGTHVVDGGFTSGYIGARDIDAPE